VAAQHWTPLHAQIHGTLRSRQLLTRSQRVLIAVSGGQDSLCLAQLLIDLQPKWGWQLAIAHCDHRWRSNSAANAAHVEHLASIWQLPFYLAIADIPPDSEAAAREWRYARLGEIACQHDFEVVVTGHTASDRAETLLFNLVRGAGADGLQALSWVRAIANPVTLVRPLLEVSRYETAAFCHAAQLTIWEDETNRDVTFARNRIRHELLPYLKAHLNPQVELALAQTAELLRADVDYLDTTAHGQLMQVLDTKSAMPRLHRVPLRGLALALQRRVMRQFLQSYLTAAPNFDQIEKLTRLITAPHRSQTDPFPGGAIAQVDAEWIVLQLPNNHPTTPHIQA
jgi:tRNA(Ile)-lysidine synthase